MPEATKALIKLGLAKGPLLQVPAVVTPTLRDIRKNIVWVKPLVRCYPGRCPSSYLLADAVLVLHDRLDQKLLQPGNVAVGSKEVSRRGLVFTRSPTRMSLT